jgi:hypothetical protein
MLILRIRLVSVVYGWSRVCMVFFYIADTILSQSASGVLLTPLFFQLNFPPFMKTLIKNLCVSKKWEINLYESFIKILYKFLNFFFKLNGNLFILLLLNFFKWWTYKFKQKKKILKNYSLNPF